MATNNAIRLNAIRNEKWQKNMCNTQSIDVEKKFTYEQLLESKRISDNELSNTQFVYNDDATTKNSKRRKGGKIGTANINGKSRKPRNNKKSNTDIKDNKDENKTKKKNPHAAGKNNEERRGTIKAMMELAEKRGGKCLSEKYSNKSTPLKWKCGIEGHDEWEATPDNVKNHGSWCPDCAKVNNVSEEMCRAVMEKLLPDYKFPNKRPDFMEGLELDGYCEKLKIAFEYNGAQHYKLSGKMCDSNEKLADQIERDNKKELLCEKNKIPLIVIRYDTKKEDFVPVIYNELKKNSTIHEELKKILPTECPIDISVEDLRIKATKAVNERQDEQYQRLLKSIQERGGELLSNIYISTTAPVTVKCDKSHIFESTFDSLVYPRSNGKRRWCGICGGRFPISTDECFKFLQSKGYKLISIIDLLNDKIIYKDGIYYKHNDKKGRKKMVYHKCFNKTHAIHSTEITTYKKKHLDFYDSMCRRDITKDDPNYEIFDKIEYKTINCPEQKTTKSKKKANANKSELKSDSKDNVGELKLDLDLKDNNTDKKDDKKPIEFKLEKYMKRDGENIIVLSRYDNKVPEITFEEFEKLPKEQQTKEYTRSWIRDPSLPELTDQDRIKKFYRWNHNVRIIEGVGNGAAGNAVEALKPIGSYNHVDFIDFRYYDKLEVQEQFTRWDRAYYDSLEQLKKDKDMELIVEEYLKNPEKYGSIGKQKMNKDIELIVEKYLKNQEKYGSIGKQKIDKSSNNNRGSKRWNNKKNNGNHNNSITYTGSAKMPGY
jgi:hypothetical protein